MNLALEVPLSFLGLNLTKVPSPKMCPIKACPSICSGDSLNCSRSDFVNLLFIARGMLLKLLKVASPAPFSIPLANKNNIKLGGNNQNEILLSLGNAMSGPPTRRGNKKLPNPPIKAGIRLSLIFINVWTISLPLNIYLIFTKVFHV
jgi:hypothetical protein